MSREYEVFVESLRQSLMERLGLNEKQIYFEERDENGMTPNGDRLFVECNASSVGKEVCGIHTEELFEDYEDGVSLEQIAKTVESEIRKLKTEDEKCIYTTNLFLQSLRLLLDDFA